MALSCCSSFNPYGGFNQEADIIDQQDTCSSDLLSFFDDENQNNSSLLDFIWELSDDDQLIQPLPDSHSSSLCVAATEPPLMITMDDPHVDISNNQFEDIDFNCLNPRKRLRTTDGQEDIDFDCLNPSKRLRTTDGQGLNYSQGQRLQCAPLEVMRQPLVFHPGRFDGLPRQDEPCLSPQSAAARQRRKKISEKTLELGKLIPGGSKMNTAQMLLAAQNYVKFMQAQVATLQLVGGFTKENEEEKKAVSVEGLNPLLSSPKMQEKLSEKQKCLVPKRLVERLANDDMLKSSPTVARQLFCLLE